MRSNYLAVFVVLIQAMACVGCAEDDIHSRLAGDWYLQSVGENPIEPGGPVQMRLVFDKAGRFVAAINEHTDRKDDYPYTIDENASTIFLEDWGNGEGVTYRYSLTEDMLSLYNVEQEDKPYRSSSMELTRTPEGLPRHAEMRQRGPSPFGTRSQMTSSVRMREIHKAALTWADANRSGARPMRPMPASIGVLVSEGALLPEYALAPWANEEIPSDFDRLSKADQAKWIDEHASYVFFVAGQGYTLDPNKLAIFELLPEPMRLNELGLYYDNTHVARVSVEEAAQIVLKQTGYTLEQWSGSASPGSGAAPTVD